MAGMLGIIVNASPGKEGPARRRVRGYDAIRRGVINDTFITTSLAELDYAVRQLSQRKCKYWLIDGGDGTVNWTINSVVRCLGEQALSRIAFMPMNSGTMNFLARALGGSGDPISVFNRFLSTRPTARLPPIEIVQSLALSGARCDPGRPVFAPKRLGFTATLGGYARNLLAEYNRHYRPGPLGLGKLITRAGAVAIAGSLPLARRPLWLVEASRRYFRPLHARVWIDDDLLLARDGRPLDTLTILTCGSLSINVGGIFRFFPKASHGNIHVQAAFLSPIRTLASVPLLMLGRDISKFVDNGKDSLARKVEVRRITDELISPAIDGDPWHELDEVKLELGPSVRFISLHGSGDCN